MELGNDLIGIIEYELAIFKRRTLFPRTIDMKNSKSRAGYLLLRYLDDYGPTAIKTLADTSHLDISTVSRQTADLEAKGFVQRFTDPRDGRVCFLQITPAGQLCLDEIKQARFVKVSKLLKNWSVEECQKFGELMGRLNRTFID